MSHSLKLRRLPRLRDLYPRARRNLEQRISQNVAPRIETDVLNLLAPYPGPVLYPFQFATDKSRRFYFWKFRDRLPYDRSGGLSASWSVSINGQIGSGAFSLLTGFVRQQSVAGTIQIIVSNDNPGAPYVYGPRQVPGHAATGWGQLVETNRAVVQQNAVGYVLDEWPGAVLDAIEEG